MRRTVSLSEFMPYGAPDLLVAACPHLASALTLSSLLAMLLFAVALRFTPFFHTSPPHVIATYIEPRPITPNPAVVVPPMPRVAPARAPSNMRYALPVPVSSAEVPPADVPASSASAGNVFSSSGADATANIPQDAPVETLPARGEYVPVDELPVAITEYKPIYPDLAREAGVEGRVIVHALIGRDGRVMRVELDEKRAIPLLNETALEAAKRWVFKPAYANGHAVAVWTSIPFQFVLHE